MDYREKNALLRINAARYYGYGWISEYIKNHSAVEILSKNSLEISFDTGISVQRAETFLKKAHSFESEKELEKIESGKFLVYFYRQEGYPECFYQIPQPPIAFYVKGDFSLFDAVAIVGTRKADAYAVRQTSKISFELASLGMGIISGLARGVDTIAHKGALKAAGKTASVIGSGLSNIYPPENKRLAIDICENGGFLLSESPLNEEPLKTNFPLRNRLISALSWGVIVMRGDYPSGSLITARHALSQGKEVMAMPGDADNPLSRGPNKLIKDGAIPVCGVEDVLNSAPEHIRQKFNNKNYKAAREDNISLNGDFRKIYSFVYENGSANCDEISMGTNMPVSKILNILFELESCGFLARKGDRYYCLK